MTEPARDLTVDGRRVTLTADNRRLTPADLAALRAAVKVARDTETEGHDHG